MSTDARGGTAVSASEARYARRWRSVLALLVTAPTDLTDLSNAPIFYLMRFGMTACRVCFEPD